MNFSLRNWIGSKLRDWRDPWENFPVIDNLADAAPSRGWNYETLYPASVQVCPGAKALPEDFLEWVDRGTGILRMHRDAVRGAEFSRFWASMLHGVYRYPMDEVFTCDIPNARVVSHGGGVLSSEMEVVAEAFFISNLLRRSQAKALKLRTMPGKFVSLLTIWGDRNIGHFFFDALLRTAAIDDISKLHFLVPDPLQPWHVGLLELAGIRREQMIPVDAEGLEVEELHVCHTSRAGCLPRVELLLVLRERFRKAAGVTGENKPWRRLFIDRSGAKRRKLANQKELEKVLLDRGFEFVRWEDYSIADQIRLASQASVIAGPHGSSLLNSVYCEPGAQLLEIINPRWWDTVTLRHSALIGHEFWYCFGEDAAADYDSVIAPRKLAKVLDYMAGTAAPEVPPEMTGYPVRTF